MCKFHQRRAQASCCVTEDRLGVPSREREMARCTGRFPQTGSSTPQLDMKIGASDRRAERHRIDARRPARGTEATRPVSTNRRTLYATAMPTTSPRTTSRNDSRSTIYSSCVESAPSASRRPISRVRWRTQYDMSPWKPRTRESARPRQASPSGCRATRESRSEGRRRPRTPSSRPPCRPRRTRRGRRGIRCGPRSRESRSVRPRIW